MPVRTRKKRSSRFNIFSVGRAAVMFSRGCSRAQVVEHYFMRYGKEWKIASITEMERFLFGKGKTGVKPRFEFLFEGKSPEAIRVSYGSCLTKLAANKSRAKNSAVELWKNPNYAAAVSNGMRAKWKDPGFASAVSSGISRVMESAWRLPEYRKKMTDTLVVLWADPKYRKRQSRLSTAGLKKKLRDPKFASEFSEVGRKNATEQWKDSEYRKKMTDTLIALWADWQWRQEQCQRISDGKRGVRHSRRKSKEVIRSGHKDKGFTPAYDFGGEVWTPIVKEAPDGALIHEELSRKVNTALTLLPNMQRQLLEMLVFHGKTLEEVCLTMGLSEAEAGEHLLAAKTSLVGSLEEYREYSAAAGA